MSGVYRNSSHVLLRIVSLRNLKVKVKWKECHESWLCRLQRSNATEQSLKLEKLNKNQVTRSMN